MPYIDAMERPAIVVREGRADELDELVAIDDAAGVRFGDVGIRFDFPEDHPFVVAERRCWREALRDRRLLVAERAGSVVGFVCLGFVDALPYIDQLSVRPELHGDGIGSLLLGHAKRWAANTGARELWLTTYAHVPWNGPYYERRGFARVEFAACEREMRDALEEQRRVLPFPEERIAMRARLG